MYNNEINLENKIDYIKDISIDTNLILDQGNIMNPEIMNNNFKNIEKFFNELYEKIRCVEDIIEYSRSFVNNEVNQTIAKCKNTISEIEKMNDISFSNIKNYTVTSIPFINSQSAMMLDRDGSPINQCMIYNNIINMSGVIKEDIKIDDVDIISNSKPVSNNSSTLLNNKSYRTIYELDAPIDGGIKETITLIFNKSSDINMIKTILANCKIEYVKYLYDDNTVLIDNEFNKSILSTKNIKSIVICICCSNYNTKLVDDNMNVNNVFDMDCTN